MPFSHSLHHGRSRRALVRIVPDGALYRIEWPDIGLSDITNLTRAKAASREWAEQKAMTEDRKFPVARRLKSLENLWWSTSYIARRASGVSGSRVSQKHPPASYSVGSP